MAVKTWSNPQPDNPVTLTEMPTIALKDISQPSQWNSIASMFFYLQNRMSPVTLTRVDNAQVSIAANTGFPSKVTRFQQDGKQRSFTGTLTVDRTNGVAELGLDTGTFAADTIYYFYLVPSAADDDILTARFSVSPPATGPTGYTNFSYVGTCGASHPGAVFRNFTYAGDWFFYSNLNDTSIDFYSGNSTTPTTGVWTDVSTAFDALVPVAIADRVQVDCYLKTTAGLVAEVYGEPGASPDYTPSSDITIRAAAIGTCQENTSDTRSKIYPVESTGGFAFYWRLASGATNWSYIARGWRDKYLRYGIG